MRITTIGICVTQFIGSIKVDIPPFPLFCRICNQTLDYGYNYIIQKLTDANLLTEDFAPLCCSCYYVLNPKTKVSSVETEPYYNREENYPYFVICLENGRDNNIMSYPKSTLERCKTGSKVERKFYEKIMSKRSD